MEEVEGTGGMEKDTDGTGSERTGYEKGKCDGMFEEMCEEKYEGKYDGKMTESMTESMTDMEKMEVEKIMERMMERMEMAEGGRREAGKHGKSEVHT